MEPPVVHGDRLQQHRAVGRQQPVAGGEELVVVREPDRLEHLDADDLVEAAAQVAIVLEPQVDAAAGVAGVGESARAA